MRGGCVSLCRYRVEAAIGRRALSSFNNLLITGHFSCGRHRSRASGQRSGASLRDTCKLSCLPQAGVLVMALLLAALPGLPSVTGSISGTVTDTSGGVIPNASVIATNSDTGVQNPTKTNAQGFYSFPALPVGRYDVEITARGMQEFEQTGLKLDVSGALRVDAKLTLGTVTQRVEVAADAVQVNTASSQNGETINSNRMTAVPLNGRSYTDLLALQPGVVPIDSGQYHSNSVSGDLNPGNLSISGQRESANGFMVNGGNVQEQMQMGTSVVPNLDSIAEFRILTNNADAEYGNYAGGQVNVITKSGTNQYHGTAFEFLRNTDLDARNFFSPTRGIFQQNQFGGTFGGPIKHDKLFFFTDYQGTRQTVGVASGLIPVPSLADRSGNLSDIAGQLTGMVAGPYWAQTLSQRLGYPVTNGEAYYTPGCVSNAQCVFPNAVIPQSAFSAPSKGLLQYIPEPTSGGFFSTSADKQTLRDDKASGRVDAYTRLGMIAGYYFIDDDILVNPYGGANLPGFSTTNNGRAQQVNLGITKTFGPTAVNELRLNYTRNAFFTNAPSGGTGVSLSSQGFQVGPNTLGIVPNTAEGVADVSLNSFNIGASVGFFKNFQNIYQVSDNFSKVVGTHTLKFGGALHYDQSYIWSYYAFNGVFQFTGGETGSDFADFLLGAPSSYQQGFYLPMYNRSRYYGFYGQDSWRATSNLTLNYGLRWEVSSPWWEAHNQQYTLVPQEQSIVFPGAPKGVVFPGDPGIPSTLAPTRYNNFAPRFGFAYSPRATEGLLGKLLGDGKTVIRGGWGVYFTAFENATGGTQQGAAPFGFFYVAPVPPMFATPFQDRATGNSEGQRFPVPAVPLNVGPNNPDNNVNWAQFLPFASSAGFFHQNRLPYAEDYNLTIERQFGRASVLSVGYVGTQAHRLLGDIESNIGNPSLCLSVSQPSEVMPGTATCGPYGADGTYYPITGGVIQGTRSPFGHAFGSNAYYATMAGSNYNSLQAKFRHSFGRLDFLAGYTFSKSLDNTSGYGGGGDIINPLNYSLTKALSSFDMTHIFVLSYSYRLPFDALWRPNRLTSGWYITGITRFSTGLPVFLTEPDDNSLLGTAFTGPTGNTIDVPNRLPGSLNITDPRLGDPNTGANPYFNTGLFTKEAIGQLGNSSRKFFHGPGLNNWDISLVKDLKLTESKSLQFRGEFFNIFNHAQFLNPNGNILSSSFGFVTGARDPRIGQVAAKFIF